MEQVILPDYVKEGENCPVEGCKGKLNLIKGR